MSLPSNIIDPDVVLVETTGIQQSTLITWFAIVVYADISNNDCICDIYEYDLANNTFATSGYFSSTKINLNNHGRYSAINIDADYAGNYVIVWDDVYYNERIIMTTGTGSTPPGTGSEVYGYGSMPDVALLESSPENTYITFVDYSAYYYANLYVIESCNGGGFRVSYWNASSAYYSSGFLFTYNDVYAHPRIACPPYTVCGKEWTIVFEDVSTQDIDGVTLYCADYRNNAWGANIYTDGGSNSPFQINGAWNTFPALSYDNLSATIMVGWQSNWATNYNPPPTCLALNCRLDGSLNTGCSSNYLIVPKSQHGDDIELSISGKYNDTMLYSFFESSQSDIMFKSVISCTSQLRIGREPNHESSNKYNLEIAPNPFIEELKISTNSQSDETMEVSIDDISGKNLYIFTGKKSNINQSLKGIASTLAMGIYFIQIKSDIGGIPNVKKIIKL